MARKRTLPPQFWTCEAVIDCDPMTRLLFLGLWTFADDLGVQPLKPRTIRFEVFPGDAIDDERVRAMIDELHARGLVRVYAVDGKEYVAVVDWEQYQSVGKRARRRYPADPAMVKVEPQNPAPKPATEESTRWHTVMEASMRALCPHSAPIEALELERATAQWIAEGCDLERDVLPALHEVCATQPDRKPLELADLVASVEANRARRPAPSGMAA
jgi:hypothetical protein